MQIFILLLLQLWLQINTQSFANKQAKPSINDTISTTRIYLLKPAAVFDGEVLHKNWGVIMNGKYIEAAGPVNQLKIPQQAIIIDLPGMTILPGLIEGHSHLLLHPYNETSWNDQVLKESLALRVARATVHARQTLLAGFTTIRDLGTEGAGYADVGLKEAIEQGIIPGPRMIIATRAIVATGSYGPKGFDDAQEQKKQTGWII